MIRGGNTREPDGVSRRVVRAQAGQSLCVPLSPPGAATRGAYGAEEREMRILHGNTQGTAREYARFDRDAGRFQR